MDATSHLGRRSGSLAAILVFILVGATSSAIALGIEDGGLRGVHKKASARYSDVRHISAKQLTALRQDEARKPLIFDVREKSEYAVSHIEGAIQVMPGMPAADFLRAFGTLLRGRTVLVYCSVGVRSMSLAARIQNAAKSVGAQEVYNLAGGIFNWHNQSRPLVNINGRTELIHPYNWAWSRLVRRRNFTSYRVDIAPDGRKGSD